MKIFRKTIVLLLLAVSGVVPETIHAQNLDLNILKGINPQNPGSTYWSVTSSSVYWLPLSISAAEFAYGAVNHDSKAKANAFQLLLNIGVSTAVSEALKYSFNRARPAESYPGIIHAKSDIYGKSFPSGHATVAFATATTLALQYRKWYVIVPAFIWAGTVSYSRMYEGYHYPSDVLAGAITGTGSSLLMFWLNKKLFKKK
jgi:membrane-associated phospholipid phosphatase